MVHGSGLMVTFGSRFRAYLWFMVHGSWLMVNTMEVDYYVLKTNTNLTDDTDIRDTLIIKKQIYILSFQKKFLSLSPN